MESPDRIWALERHGPYRVSCSVLDHSHMGEDATEYVRADILERMANALDPEVGIPSDHLLRCIHADLEMRGRKNSDFAVSVHHRNIVLSAVANALRSSSLLTWDEWLEHCGWPKEGAE